MTESFFDAAFACLTAADLTQKVELTQRAARRWARGELALDHDSIVVNVEVPGRPELPRLVEPHHLPKRTPGTAARHAALMHSIAHIEFNAINLAWDAAYRFRGMPDGYYGDWVRVAAEEAYHFSLIDDYLARHGGYAYGDFDAHDGLWKLALSTADDVLKRMALVPRVMEARGLDVTPDMIKRLRHHGYADAVAILEIIYRDEIGHVEIGTRWFESLCRQRQLDPETTFKEMVLRYVPDRIRPPINDDARSQAGFSRGEIAFLNGLL